ncbi:hypothetical protein L1987_14682 [Smallanthus sonchifolius]|uniref:Uncharacterized protein n=1 Tax=Smallanthus sonchifolius TaxID=185202 RepID=A0ACB9J625_9ASTR|nr:hypothetical protein L1987_14682 [Smallanthus sonchifolius]
MLCYIIFQSLQLFTYVDDDVDLEADSVVSVFGDTFDTLIGISPLRCVGYDKQGSHSCSIYQTPNGTKYWYPEVKAEHKPLVGKIYSSWDEIYMMYETYAEMSGFGIRVSGYKRWKGEITHKVLVCITAGNPRSKEIDSLDPKSMVPSRGKSFKVSDCKAHIRVKVIKGSTDYLVYEFSENHNHELVSSDNMDLTRKGSI